MKKHKPVRIVPIADKPVLTVDEAAALSGFGRTSIYREIETGRLVARRSHEDSGRTVILRPDFDAWVAAFVPIPVGSKGNTG